MTTLLDANVLIALVITDHVHHDTAKKWLDNSDEAFATCPITEGSLLRALLRKGLAATSAQGIVTSITAMDRHEFWPDTLPYSEAWLDNVIGHRQVTDAYLAQLARWKGGRLVTFDQGLAQLHKDVADHLPTIPTQQSR